MMIPLSQISRFNLAGISLVAALTVCLVGEAAINTAAFLADWRHRGLPPVLGILTLSAIMAGGLRNRPSHPPRTLLTVVGSLALYVLIGLPLWFFLACATGTVCL